MLYKIAFFLVVNYFIHNTNAIPESFPELLKVNQSDSTLASEYSDMAKMYRRKRMADSSIFFLQKASEIYLKLNDWEKYFDREIQIGELIERKQMFDSSLQYFGIIQRQFDSLEFFDYYIQYRINDNLGIINGRVRNYLQGIDAFKDNVALTKSSDPKDSTKTLVNLARTFNNLAIIYADIASYEISNMYYDSALIDLRANLSIPTELEHVIYNNKARNFKSLGYFDDAFDHFIMSEKIMNQLEEGAIDPVERGLFYWSFGSYYLFKNQSEADYENAKKYNDSAEYYFQSVDEDMFYLSYCDYVNADLKLKTEEWVAVKTYANSAKKRLLRYFGEDYSELSYVNDLMGRAAIGEGKPEESLQYFQEAISRYQRIDYNGYEEISTSYLNQSKAYRLLNQNENALLAIQHALEEVIPDFEANSTIENPTKDQILNLESIYEALLLKAEILVDNYNSNDHEPSLVSAVDCYNLLLNHINLSRGDIYNLRSKNSLSERRNNLYSDAIEVMLLAYENTNDIAFLEQAFETADLSKSNSLNESLAQQHQLVELNIPPSWKTKEREIKAKISFTEKIIYELKKEEKEDIPSIAEAQEDLFKFKEELQQHLFTLKNSHPYFFNSKQRKNIKVENIKPHLKDNMALLQYFIASDNIYLFVLTDQVDLLSIPLTDTLNNSISQLIEKIKGNQFDLNQSYQVAMEIFNPILPVLQGKAIRQLVIIPDGILNYLPFEILPIEKPKSAELFSENKLLINDYISSYHYAASLIELFGNQVELKDKPSKFYGFAPEFNQQNNALIASRSAENISIAESLNQLPKAMEEVKYSSSIWNGISYLGQEATESNFKNIGKEAGILHLASHAIIDDQNPMYSKIVFSSPTEGSDEDGLLYTYELYNMEFKAQLACLSACNTGFGKIQSGEGVVSLGRGFMYAGVPNIMMSLWSVPDQSTSDIMKHFYENLGLGMGKAEALRAAKLKYLTTADNNTISPYYWAAFTLIGDNEPINTSDQNESYWLWILSVLIIVGLAILFIRSSKSVNVENDEVQL